VGQRPVDAATAADQFSSVAVMAHRRWAGTMTTTNQTVFLGASRTLRSSNRNLQFCRPTQTGLFTRSNRVKEK
jgi:hypothetical protein